MPGYPAGAVFVDVVPSFSGFPNALRSGLVGPAGNAGSEAGSAAGDGVKGGVLGSIGKLAGPLTAAVGALGIGAILTSAISSGMENEKITDRLAASLGATGPTAEKLGKVAGTLYAGAYGESMEEVADGLQGILSSGLIDQDAAQSDIEALGAKVFNLSSTFGEEAGRIATTAESLLRNGLAANADEAFDVLTVGFQNGTNKAEDLLDTFIEYGPIFSRLGIDGTLATGLLSQGLQAGARDADTVADALKEFQIRATDASESSAAGFEALGLNAEEMTAKIAQGGQGASDGLALVLNKLRETEDPVARNAAAVALFGTKAEDLGASLFALDPQTAVEGLGDVAGAATTLGDTLNDNASTNIESFKRQLGTIATETIGGVVLPGIGNLASTLATGLGPAFKEFVGGLSAFRAAFNAADGDVTSAGFPGVMEKIANVVRVVYENLREFAGGVASFVEENRTGLTILAGAVGGAALAFGALYAVTQLIKALQFGVFLVQYAAQVGIVNLATKIWAGTQALLNVVLSANPIGVVVVLLGALIGAVILAWRNSETFRSIVLGAWSAVKDGVGSVVSWFTDTALPFVRGVFEDIGAAATFLYENVIEPVWAGIKRAVELYVGFVVGYVNAWISVLTFLGDGVTALYKGVIEPVFTLIRDVIRFAWEWLLDNVFRPFADWLTTKLRIAFNAYRDVAVAVWTAVRDAINAAWSWVRDNVLNPLVGYFRDTLAPRFVALRDTAVSAWELIRAGVDRVWIFLRDNVFAPLGIFLLVTVPGYFTRGKDAVGTAWDLVKAKVQEPITWLANNVWAPLNTFLTVTLPGYFSSAATFVGKAWDAIKKAAGTPVKFVVDTIINNGIVDTFNAIARAVGSSASLSRITLPREFASFATGGRVSGPGTGTSDDVPAWLSNGEYVVKASRVRELGTGFMDALNAGRFASGGLIGSVTGALTDPVGSLRGVVNGLLGSVPGGGTFRSIVSSLPVKVLDLVVGKVKGLVDSILGGEGGIGEAGGAGGIGYQWQMSVLRKAFPGLQLISGLRPGAITATGNPSWHGRGRAVDIPPRGDVFEWIRTNYGASTKELIFSPKGNRQLYKGQNHVYGEPTRGMHFDHVHWAYRNGGLVDQPLSYDRGGYLPPGMSSVFNGTGSPEPVFTRAQASALVGGPSSADVVEALNRLAALAATGNVGNVEGLDRLLVAVEASPRKSLALARQGAR